MGNDTFLRELIMEVEHCQETHQVMGENIGVMAKELVDIDRELASGIRNSWQGNSAVEFFALYDKLFPALNQKVADLDRLSRNFLAEINDWIEMARALAS
jgi:uncharacterized protein YukE